MNATLPLATLSLSAHGLNLKSVIGSFSFAPEDVVRVDRVMWFPLLASGVRIVHVREDIAERVIFWHLTPGRVLSALSASGFTPKADAAEMPVRRFPFRIPFLVGAVLLWNLIPLALDFDGENLVAGFGMLTTLGLAALTALSILLPTPMRRLALHDPNNVRRVTPGVGLMFAITSLLFGRLLLELLGN